MFESLKKKLGGWFKKEEPEEKKPKKTNAEKTKKVSKVTKPEKKIKVKPEEKKSEKARAEKIVSKGDSKKVSKKEIRKEEEIYEKETPEEEDEELLEEEIKESAKELQKESEENNENDSIKDGFVSRFFGRRKKAAENAEKDKTAKVIPLPKDFEQAAIEKIEAESKKGEALEEEEADRDIEKLAESEEGGFFAKLAKKMSSSALSDEDFNEFFDEFETILLENNVALEVVDKIRESLKNSLGGKQFKKSEVKDEILEALKKSIELVLIDSEDLVNKIKKSGKEPYVVLFFGINGSGKTTSIAKLAWKLKNSGLNVVLGAGDTFRAASIEQLKEHGNRIGVPAIAQQYQSDPAAVAFDAIQYAKKHGSQVVSIDTAGRMYTKMNLMKEMEKIVRVSQPDLKIFVGESITGNDATEQARMFNETAGIDGIILSKADVDEKAGTILSVGHVTGKPIFYLGVGQEYKDLENFSKNKVMKGLGLD